MPGTFTKILYHIVFATKYRTPWITDNIQSRLYDYIGATVRGERGTLHTVGGMPDHVHLLIRWRTDETIANLMRNIKSHSSKWIHDTFADLRAFAWQDGYGAFSVSESQLQTVMNYINNQAEHHRTRTFEDEFEALLIAHGVEYDRKYLWESQMNSAESTVGNHK